MGGAALNGVRIDREIIPILADNFVSTCLRANDIPYYICGSYRRGKKDCGDIEIVFHANEGDRRNLLQAKIMQIFGMTLDNKPKMQGLYGQVQFDLFIADDSSLGAMLMHATGSGDFNVKMRTAAMKRGWLLNQYGLFKRVDRTPVVLGKDEATIFCHLGMEYIKPEDRI